MSAAAMAASLLAFAFPAAADPPAQPDPASVAAMMEKAKKLTQPGENHKVLERFLGRWSTETRVFLPGEASPPEKGSGEFSWLMPGRWLQGRSSGAMMGMPIEAFWILGHDNFKMSFVTAAVTTMDTALNHSEGDLDQHGKTLLTYGTVDEYLTGEHDKMVKYVWRFLSPDRIVLEVHDLPIGETNTKVVETTFIRKP